MKIELRRVHVVGEDTGFTSPSKRPTTGDPTLSPTAGISPPGVGLGAASWKREMALMVVFGSVAHLVIKICGSNKLPWTVQSGSATATDLDPHQLRLHSLLHWWAPLYPCILWQTPPVGESGKRDLRLPNLLFREKKIHYYPLTFFTTLRQELFCSLGTGQSDSGVTGIWNKRYSKYLHGINWWYERFLFLMHILYLYRLTTPHSTPLLSAG